MTRPAAIIDTHVVVAGLLTQRTDSPVARILNGMLSAAFPFVLSEALLAEYHAVLVLPKLRKLHGLTVAEVDSVLTDLAQNAIVLTPNTAQAAPPAPDPGGQMLWDLLATKAGLLLVTGDKRLLDEAGMRGRVILAKAFLASE